MKKLKIQCEKDGKLFFSTVYGEEHLITLNTGEEIKLFSNYNEKYGFYNISDYDTGLQICGSNEYFGFWQSLVDMTTIDGALGYAKSKIENVLSFRKMTYQQFQKRAISRIEKLRKGEQDGDIR